jgi:hypothetical protein
MERRGDLLAAVRSLRGQQQAVHEIIVVVDRCPELAEFARSGLGGVRVVETSSAGGLSAARNTGVAAASGEVVAFLGDDAHADPDWSARLLAAYTDRDVLGVGWKAVPRWDTGRPGWFPAEFDWVIGCSHHGLPEQRAQVPGLNGTTMSLRRSALESAGGFRPDGAGNGKRAPGCEETELYVAVDRSRPEVRLLYEPAALVHRRVPAERTRWSYFRARCYAEGLCRAGLARHYDPDTDGAPDRWRRYPAPAILAGFIACLRRGRVGAALALLVGALLTGFGYLVGTVGEAREQGNAAAIAICTRYSAPVIALALWLAALRGVRPTQMNDVGLISVLPPAYWAALAVLTIGFSIAVRARDTTPTLLLAYILVLIAMIHATPALTYPTLRYSWAWKHVSIIDYLVRHNALDPNGGELAPYYQWPGFFTLNTLIIKATGLSSALSYAAWAPPVLNTMMLGPLLMIFRSATRDRRLQWTGLWVFYSGSWIGQDYLSPQGFAFVLYLAVLAVVLRRLTRGGPEPGSAGTAGKLALMLTAVAAIDSSHQLTPIILVTALAALAIALPHRRVTVWLLGVSVALMVAWDATAARGFFRQNLAMLMKSFGTLDANANSGVISLATVSTGQVIVADVDRALSAGIWVLALWALVRRRPGVRRTPLLMLMLAPLPALLANDYGGEILYRVYFFSLPGAALLAAAALTPRDATEARRADQRLRRVRLQSAALVFPVLLALLASAQLISYYGKERANYFSPAEVQAAQYLAAHAQTGSLIIAETPNYAAAYDGYERTTRDWLLAGPPSDQIRTLSATDPVAAIRLAALGWQTGPVYFILTDSQLAEIQMEGMLTTNALNQLTTGLTPANGFTVVYRNADAAVYSVATPASGNVRP